MLNAEARRDRASFLQETHRLLATDEELATILIKSANSDDLTELEIYQMQEFWLSVLYNLELALTVMPEDELESTERRIRWFFENNIGFQLTWSEKSHRFSPDFVAWMESFRTHQ